MGRVGYSMHRCEDPDHPPTVYKFGTGYRLKTLRRPDFAHKNVQKDCKTRDMVLVYVMVE
jgi:hypothetical protein